MISRICLLSFVGILMLLSGCRSEESIDYEELYTDADFYYTVSIQDLARDFKEFGYTINDTEIDLIFPGKDYVDGVQAEHVRIKTSYDEFEFWLDENGELVKSVLHEEHPEEDAEEILEFFREMLGYFFEDHGFDKQWLGGEISTVTRDLGEGPVQATRFEWNPYWLHINFKIEVAEVAGKQLVIMFRHVTKEGADAGGWFLHRVIPR